MAHFRTMYDNKYLGAWDLQGHDVTVTIATVAPATLDTDRGKTRKGLLTFVGKDKGMVCNVTNGKTIAQLYGPDYNEWVGKRITLYPSKTSAGGGETVDCIRVRPQEPKHAKTGGDE